MSSDKRAVLAQRSTSAPRALVHVYGNPSSVRLVIVVHQMARDAMRSDGWWISICGRLRIHGMPATGTRQSVNCGGCRRSVYWRDERRESSLYGERFARPGVVSK